MPNSIKNKSNNKIIKVIANHKIHNLLQKYNQLILAHLEKVMNFFDQTNVFLCCVRCKETFKEN